MHNEINIYNLTLLTYITSIVRILIACWRIWAIVALIPLCAVGRVTLVWWLYRVAVIGATEPATRGVRGTAVVTVTTHSTL